MDELITINEKITELDKKLAAIHSLLQRLPEIQAAVFLRMYDEYQRGKLCRFTTKDL